ncbi:MAG: hypothetical protein ABSG84_12315 [Acidobacteriaceae bacterium]|jgi:hypothetical protein
MTKVRLLVGMVCGLAMAGGVAAQVWTPPVQQHDKDIAAETGSNVGDFPDAVMNGPAGTQEECSVEVRVMRAGSMTPIVRGVRLTADTIDEHGHPTPGGKLTVTAEAGGIWMIRNVPPHFLVADSFDNGGAGRGWISRRCWGSVQTLLLVVHDPSNLGKGADWVWDKNGKYAMR